MDLDLLSCRHLASHGPPWPLMGQYPGLSAVQALGVMDGCCQRQESNKRSCQVSPHAGPACCNAHTSHGNHREVSSFAEFVQSCTYCAWELPACDLRRWAALTISRGWMLSSSMDRGS